jgi:hypothetical protein
MGLLPPRPLRLDSKALSRRRLKKTALAAFVGAMGLAFLGAAAFVARELIEERQLWNQGTDGRVVEYSGNVEKSQFLGLTIIYDYKLEVHWIDASGSRRKGSTRFSRMFVGIPQDDEPRLRYDKSAPERFVLSWAAQGGLARYGTAIGCLALGLLMVLGAISLVRSERRRTRALQMSAEDGEEVFGRVQKTWQYRGTHYVHYRLPDDPKLRKYQGDAPLILMRDGAQHVLLLRSPRAPDAPYLVEADLRAFELSPEERARFVDAVQTIPLTG